MYEASSNLGGSVECVSNDVELLNRRFIPLTMTEYVGWPTGPAPSFIANGTSSDWGIVDDDFQTKLEDDDRPAFASQDTKQVEERWY
jgi:hypothetical protein